MSAARFDTPPPPVPPPPAPPPPEGPSAPRTPPRDGHLTDILLVDDQPRNLDALEAILADPGYRLLRALDADSALRLLLSHDVAAIVLDIKMPGTSGLELARMIKGTRRFRQIPILFLTAYLVEDVDVINGYGSGAVDYLTKPLRPEILRHKVAIYAELFRKTRALAELNETLEARVRERTAELARSEAALREADGRKNEFIAVLAHELRNPLAPLRFGLEILQGHEQRLPGPPRPTIQRTLASMNRQLDHIVRLVEDLLDISRITQGFIELKKEECDLGAVLAAASEAARPFIEARRHALVLAAEEPLVTLGDPIRIAQIVGNLLHNAAKFTPEGGRITLSLAREGAQAVIRVSDSGEGIAPDQIERAFGLFARIPRSDSRAERGLGVGLALGRELAELHGGTLEGESEGLGRGTTFTLRLPLLGARPVIVADPVEADDGPAARPRDPGLEIVVIEDSEDIAEGLSLLLEELGHRVSVAHTGPGGLRLVEERRPEVVLCDLGLPDMDGVEVCRRVHQLGLPRRPRMIALTGWGREEDRRRTRDAGFDEHLVKPVTTARLRHVLRTS